MSISEIDITGGESVYCINEGQLERARELAYADATSSPRIQNLIGEIESSLDRNERAALAFMLLENLLQSRKT